MTVKELINELSKLPQDAEVNYIWDGCARSEAKSVWLSRNGAVMISDNGVVYDDEDRPTSAPTEKEEPYWKPGD